MFPFEIELDERPRSAFGLLLLMLDPALSKHKDRPFLARENLIDDPPIRQV